MIRDPNKAAYLKHKARARKRSTTITLAWSKDHLRVIGKIERVVRD